MRERVDSWGVCRDDQLLEGSLGGTGGPKSSILGLEGSDPPDALLPFPNDPNSDPDLNLPDPLPIPGDGGDVVDDWRCGLGVCEAVRCQEKTLSIFDRDDFRCCSGK